MFATYPKKRFHLKWKMIVLISVLVMGICVIFAVFFHYWMTHLMEDQVGKRALSVSKSVADMPEIRKAFQLEEPASEIQTIVQPIQKDTGAEFIVVGNRKGIRYSHPDTDKLGAHMVGGDNKRALKGESYVSKRTGSLGLSIRGKTPIYDQNGTIIGLVSVGFLSEDVQGLIKQQSSSVWLTLAGILLLGVMGAIVIAHYIKRRLYDMEPEEIAHVLVQKEAILQSTHEGIMAIDKSETVTMINQAAQQILFQEKPELHQFIGRSIKEFLPHTELATVLKNGERHYSREMILGDQVILVNQMPIFYRDEIVGAVSTFREKTELENVTNELLQIKQYANAQRAQTHEFSNKLYTILGLLQLDQTDEAITYIKQENNTQSEWSQFLVQHVADPMIQGLLQGKFNQANELGINMRIHPDSQLNVSLSSHKRNALLTALGNIIENAVEILRRETQPKQEISIFFTDIGDDIIIEVDDSGPGIPMNKMDRIFEQGYSTKNESHHGTGLALSMHVLRKTGGNIMLEESDLGGACFMMAIPKDKDDEK